MGWNIYGKKCMRCGACIGVCSTNAVELKETGISFDEEKCTSCNSCGRVCPVNAIEVNAG